MNNLVTPSTPRVSSSDEEVVVVEQPNPKQQDLRQKLRPAERHQTGGKSLPRGSTSIFEQRKKRFWDESDSDDDKRRKKPCREQPAIQQQGDRPKQPQARITLSDFQQRQQPRNQQQPQPRQQTSRRDGRTESYHSQPEDYNPLRWNSRRFDQYWDRQQRQRSNRPVRHLSDNAKCQNRHSTSHAKCSTKELTRAQREAKEDKTGELNKLDRELLNFDMPGDEYHRRCKILEEIPLDEWPVGATPGEKAQFLEKMFADPGKQDNSSWEKGDEMFSRAREEEINASAIVSDNY